MIRRVETGRGHTYACLPWLGEATERLRRATSAPFRVRRAELERLRLDGQGWTTPEIFTDGAALFEPSATEASEGLSLSAAEEVERAHEVAANRAVKALDGAVKAHVSFIAASRPCRARDRGCPDETARHRALLAQAIEECKAVLGEAFAWPTSPDEVWEIDEKTLAFLSDGPLRPLADEEAAQRERAETEARQFEEQAKWLRGARSPGETRTRLKQVLGGFDPDSERAARFRAVAAEREAYTAKESASSEQREKRERSAFPRIPKEEAVRF